MRREYGRCLCGATDCPECGPLQGYDPDADIPEDEYEEEEQDATLES